MAIQQPEGHEGAVEAGVDVEAVESAVGTGIVPVPLVRHELPRLLPVLGVLRRPGQHVADHLRVAALGRDGAQARLHDPARVVLEKGGGVHPPEEHPAVEPVAVVHHAAHAVGVLVGLLGKPRRHEADEVRLDLEVDVVGVDVVLRVARPGGLDAVIQQAPRPRVRVPEVVLRVLEHLAVLLGGGFQTEPVHHLREGHLHVEVVLVDRVRDVLRLPRDRPFDRPALEPELGGGTEGDADHLPGPAAADLVFESAAGEPAGRRRRVRRARGGGGQDGGQAHDHRSRRHRVSSSAGSSGVTGSMKNQHSPAMK